MPARRKETAELALVGAFKRNPERLKEREGGIIDARGLGAPPERLSAAEQSALGGNSRKLPRRRPEAFRRHCT